MPSTLHEVLVEMFRNQPLLAVDLLTDGLGMRLPRFQHAEVQSNEFTDITPTEYRADVVVTLTFNSKAVFAVVVEAQLRTDERKRWSWPVYLSTLRARSRCPAVLLVICVDTSTASWCAKPIDLGHPGWVLTPLTMGPDQVPLVIDGQAAIRTPELACLSAIAHADHPEQDRVFGAFLEGLTSLDLHRRALYSDFVYQALPVAAQKCLEELLTTRRYEYQSEFVRKYIFQGRAEGHEQGLLEGKAHGEAAALLGVIEARGLSLPEEVRARIVECTDITLLDGWVRRAATASSVDELFDQVQHS